MDRGGSHILHSYRLRDLDCETAYEFRVSGRGGGETYSTSWGIPGEATATTGDCEEPEFSQETYEAEILSGTPAGTAVLSVSATDPTTEETLEYAIASGNENGNFAINSGTGEITVSSDLGTGAVYNLGVTVTDLNNQTDTATVVITVMQEVAISFQQATITVPEGIGGVAIAISLDNDPQRDLTVPLTFVHQGGLSSDDYSGLPESVTFSAGDASPVIIISITDDADDEPGESLSIGFGTLPRGVTLGTHSEVVLTIQDNDPTTETLLSATMTVGNYGGYRGFIAGATHGSPNGSLTDVDFVLNGVTYMVSDLLRNLDNTYVSISLSADPDEDATNLFLMLGTRQFAFPDGGGSWRYPNWNLGGETLEWNGGDSVEVRLLLITP